MTGDQCSPRRKGGYDVGIVNSRVPIEISRENCEIGEIEQVVIGKVDLFTQARKALSERCPFELEDGQAVKTVVNLPKELADLLCKKSDGRKRHKKSHSAVESKSTRVAKSKGAVFWARNEEYFRGLSVDDIDKLYQLGSFKYSGGLDCFMIPVLKNVRTFSGVTNGNASNLNNKSTFSGVTNGNASNLNDKSTFSGVQNGNASSLNDVSTFSGVMNGNASNLNDESGDVTMTEEEDRNDKHDQKLLEGECGRGKGLVLKEKDSTLNQQGIGLEWLLGSRSKVYLTSERPNKKRKLLGGDAGLEKLFVASAVEGSSSLCHYCSLGETGDQLNRLIVCSSCSMAVHQRCYGVQEDVSESWLCSWCKNKNQKENLGRPCLLCPKQAGALKPVRKKGCGSDSNGFAHLFCCQWMPEVYIEDTRRMEPIMNVEGIMETRHKLICRLCKIRYGACLRCSNGACRASFHPICAREARHRMEIWGRFGSDDVELRAYCSKHTEVQSNITTLQDGDSRFLIPDASITKHQPVSSTMIKTHKIKISRKNEEKVAGHLETAETDLDRVDSSVPSGDVLPDASSNLTIQLDCGDTQQSNNAEINTSECLSFQLSGLKKLIDRGRVNMNDVASEIGVSPEVLASNLIGEHLVPEVHSKVVEWLKNHANIGPLQRNLKVRFKNLTKVEAGATDETDVTVSESCIPDVSVTSVPPRRRTKNDIRILKDGKPLCLTKSSLIADGIAMSDKSAHHLATHKPACQSEKSVPDTTQKILMELVGSQDILRNNSSMTEGEGANSLISTAFESLRVEEGAVSENSAALGSLVANPVCNTAVNFVPGLIETEAVACSYMHPTIKKTLSQMPYLVVSRLVTEENDVSREGEFSALEASSSSSICCNHQSEESVSPGSTSKCGDIVEQLAQARKMGILEQSPADEVEGELVFFQQQLLHNAIARKLFSDDLIVKVLTNLPKEIDAIGKQKWDAVTANKYLCELKELKRQGRKERRHKEAQVVLAAATAAAAASSRISSFRKDTQEESAHRDIVNSSSGRASIYSQQMPRAKETISRLGTTRVSSEKNYDAVHSTTDFSKEYPRTCEICRRSETILNPILICSSCKVAVHLDCYRSVKDSAGPWNCELCEELSSSRSFGAASVNSWEKPYSLAECGLCGGTAGAFRKSTDGQWIHAFCAEWILESTYKRGQANLVQGMETISKGSEMCHICQRKQGVCIKCNYGHCQSCFHPSCAKGAGFHMNVKAIGGKLQHKAYCERHSLVERAKVETQKHGIEEIKSLKPVRVELEKLRLLCERIIKREKLKRELVLCSHEILASNREAVALSALTCSSLCPTDVSSESATTSLKGKRRNKFPVSMDNDQKTDDSSTSQQFFPSKPSDRSSFSGKQIPSRPSSAASWSFPSEGEKHAKFRKHTETFEKELVMTSDQASMKNQRLPKGFVYVPIRCLSNEKEAVPDACTQEELNSDE
ncbi:Histone-lysine n-methyltransferase atx1 [Heracleum sosnowskyi]|uniref:Histone-lysine n-methyltransferase atx1 n=1 Tax=Heracleum sosnowskyi TaxID=360622 RepID=A0AAD8H6Y8_9APIA|nr:Histone-lysine n-methyltransferase atx1 [Heracleum sosnowskyi]